MGGTQRILLCGISGTRVSVVGEKLAEHLQTVVGSSNGVLFTNFEEHFCREAGDQDITTVLQGPPENLYTKYQSTWKQRIFACEQNCAIHIIACHLVYHPKLTSTFFSLLEHSYFEQHEIDKIIVVIDDIFDIYPRLYGFTENTSDSNQIDSLTELQEVVSDLFILLRWREQEFARAVSLAKSLRTRVYCVANKHSISTFSDLVLGAKPTIYVSHPITQIRRAGISTEESKLFIDMLHEICDELSRDFVVFAPTTIDEYRFERVYVKTVVDNRVKERNVVLPVSTARWPLVFSPAIEPMSWEPTYSPIGSSCLERIRQFAAETTIESDVIWQFVQWSRSNDLTADGDYQNSVQALSARLDILMGFIEQQVTARDIAMVRQSDHIFVFRPIYKAVLSGGVQREIKYFRERFEQKGDDSKVIIYSSPEFKEDVPALREIMALSIMGKKNLFEPLQLTAEDDIARAKELAEKINITRVLEFLKSPVQPINLVREFEAAVQETGVVFAKHLGSRGPLPPNDRNEENRHFITELMHVLHDAVGLSKSPHTINLSQIPHWSLAMEPAKRRQCVHGICEQIKKSVLLNRKEEQ